MTNYSRTTLRELKKRYLNILKKCLLANLMAFSFMLPAGAEESLLDKLMAEGPIVIDHSAYDIEIKTDTVIRNEEPLGTSKIKHEPGWGKVITFFGDGKLSFEDFKVKVEDESVEGGIIGMHRPFTFNVETHFKNNTITSTGNTTHITGGAVSFLYEPIIFSKDAYFINNGISVEKKSGSGFRPGGGAIVTNYSTLDFKGNATFENNYVSSKMGDVNGLTWTIGGAILSSGNEKITFTGVANFKNNRVETEVKKGGGYIFGGAIYNGAGIIDFLSTANFNENKVLMNAEINGGETGGGALYAGTYNFYGEANFIENMVQSILKNDTSYVGANGGAIRQATVTFYENANFLNNKTKSYVENSWISSQGGAIYGGTHVFKKDVKFIKNELIAETKIAAGVSVGGAIDSGTSTFEGNAYFIQNKASMKMQEVANDGFQRAGGGAISQGTRTFEKGAFFIQNITESIAKEGKSRAQGGAIFSGTNIFNGDSLFYNNIATVSSGSGIVTANGGAIYNDKPIEFNGKTMFMDNTVIGSTLGEIIVEGGAIYNAAAGVVNLNSDFDFSGNKTIKNGVERKNDIYNEGTVNIAGDKETVGVLSGGINGVQVVTQTETETTTKIPQINKSGEGLLVLGDNSENHEYEGAFTQTAGVTIANSERFFSHELAQNTINGGELKTHGAEIAYKATLGETGTLTHLGTSADTPTEIKGVIFNGTGLNLTFGTYTKAEQEKEISLVGDRLIEYIDENGKTVRYQATDKLFAVNALENDQKAKFILNENLPGMEGNSITVAGAELDVKEGLKVAGKVIAKDMRFPAGKTSSFTALEVAEKGLLDIQNQTVTADTLSLNQEGAVKVSVHSLSDYGQILAKETVSKGAGTLTMNLVGAPQEGVYKVFEQDTDLKLATTHEFFDISDLENGSYKIARKKANELAEKFGLNEEETRTVSAVIGGNSENKAFQKVQTEIMETLKSGNKGKAKKALSAVVSKEQPVEQSVASEHLVALQNVVQAELHGAGVGRAGGDTDPRAKVYIKGLYDRTKSTMGDGFKARSQGAVLGVQSEVTEDLTLGVGYATSQTTAKEDLRRTEVDTNTGFISAHYQPNAWWVSGLATFSRGEYEEEKQVLSSTGKATYDVDSWGAQVMTGYDIKLENAIITPEVGMRYLSVKQEGYTDTLGTMVSGTQSDYLTALVGVKGTWDMGAIRPTAGVTVGYDIISDDVSALNTLANGASYTVNGEALDRLSTTVTTGIEADLGERTTLKLEYSGTYRKEYVDHSGMLKLEVKF